MVFQPIEYIPMFADNCAKILGDRGVKERAGDMQERYIFLASLYEIMEGNGVAISEDTRTAANMIAKVPRNTPATAATSNTKLAFNVLMP